MIYKTFNDVPHWDKHGLIEAAVRAFKDEFGEEWANVS